MQFYWSIEQIPELAGLTPAQKKQAWQFCYKKYVFTHWQSWVSLFALGLLVSVGTKLFNLGNSVTSSAIGGAIGGGLGGAIFGVTTINVLRPHLIDYANTHFTIANSSTEPSLEE
ncbi:hypothetical protein V2H45_08170 [Tumidithrix elongata RA019]|uniref:Uncharacterized protein n=1 Tax=Tumidithrix elongata BACA0141 TaxID=2716417 RepID=A0AAW9PWG1_9CYAN|nr:hypothetical protein [Tumidithrix elongata RA019]